MGFHPQGSHMALLGIYDQIKQIFVCISIVEGVLAIKGYSTFPKTPELEPQQQIDLSSALYYEFYFPNYDHEQ